MGKLSVNRKSNKLELSEFLDQNNIEYNTSMTRTDLQDLAGIDEQAEIKEEKEAKEAKDKEEKEAKEAKAKEEKEDKEAKANNIKVDFADHIIKTKPQLYTRFKNNK